MSRKWCVFVFQIIKTSSAEKVESIVKCCDIIKILHEVFLLRLGDAMDYFIVIWSVVVFVENQLLSGFEYAELEKATANYLGEDVDYDYAMVSSGAVFRLVWDETCWNGGNVDVLHTFDDPIMIYKNGIESIGHEFKLLGRENRLTRSDPAKFSSIESNATKEDFIKFIKEQIDKGYPCIGFGFIGPPEA